MPRSGTWQKVLAGRRVKPADLPMVAFLGRVMRSLRADHIRRARHGVKRDDPLWLGSTLEESWELDVLDPAADPERAPAAADLGVNLKMKGSAAFIGVKYTLPKRIEDIFDVEELRKAYAEFLRKQRSFLPDGRKKDREDDEK